MLIRAYQNSERSISEQRKSKSKLSKEALSSLKALSLKLQTRFSAKQNQSFIRGVQLDPNHVTHGSEMISLQERRRA